MKNSSVWSTLLAGMLAAAPVTGFSQEDFPSPHQVRVSLGSARVINYKYLGGTAKIGFRGTVLLPLAEGTAKVRSHEGGVTIQAAFEHLEPATRFGPEYMTYVLWAISPVGQATNLGEVIVKASGKGRITATTHLQTFGLIVAAEPHFAVTSISDLVVAENVLTEASKGKVEEVEAHYALMPKGSYVLEGNPASLVAPKPDRRISPYVHQARNAMRIARADQADTFAPEAFLRAEATYRQMEAEKKLWKRPAVLLARQTVQLAEDARMIGAKAREAAQHAEERNAAEEARVEAEKARVAAESARKQAIEEALQAKEWEVKQAAQQATNAVKQALRKQLTQQLGNLLQTQDTDKGLIVRMSNVLFPTGQAVLRPQARERFAKVAGILLAYPGLKFRVEGHTDATGKPEFNRKLSEQRAANVRNFLIQQGISPQAITAEGLGDSSPLTDNTTPSGRQQNRRVELIVAGDPVGI